MPFLCFFKYVFLPNALLPKEPEILITWYCMSANNVLVVKQLSITLILYVDIVVCACI